jgi:hypothetical protein
VQTLGIAGDLVVVLKGARNKRPVGVKFQETSEHPSPMDDSD